jgi:hypothetical protein
VRRALIVMAVAVTLAGAVAGARVWMKARAVQAFIERHIGVPDDPPPDLLHRWFDVTPVPVVFTAAWEKFFIAVPRYVFETDPTIWARMHFEDWDRIPAADRGVALEAMLARSGLVIHAGNCWPYMTATDWDMVPQPIRAVAILGLLEYWTRYYAVGELFELDIGRMVHLVQAIVMSESWFEHRSLLVNDDGSRDIGLAGASAYARDVIRRWHADGRVDFSFEDDEAYYNPWHAARFIAFWFDLMLSEADGDVELAIRAYNQGIARARAGGGDAYLAAVERRLRQFIGAETTRSPTWNAVRAWSRQPPPAHRPRCHRTMSSPRISAQPDSARMLQ